MALIHADRVWQTSNITGTGTYNLTGTVTGYRTFVAAIGDGNLCYYVATDGTDWEIGLGTVTDAATDTLARTRVIKSSNSDAAVNWGAGDKDIFVSPIAAMIKNAAPNRGYIWDLEMSNAADATNDITVAAGEATDETGEVVMVLSAAITKQIDAGWAVGTNAGGLNTGAVANSTWYEVLLIYRQDTGVVDVMFSTEANRNTLPTNYTHKRHIGWVRRGTATNLAFTQKGDIITLTAGINDISATATASATSRTLTVPPGCIARFRGACLGNTSLNAANGIVFSELAESDVAPATSNGHNSIGSGDFALVDAGHFELRVNGSSQIRDRAISATGSMAYDIETYGWIDNRRRLKDASA